MAHVRIDLYTTAVLDQESASELAQEVAKEFRRRTADKSTCADAEVIDTDEEEVRERATSCAEKGGPSTLERRAVRTPESVEQMHRPEARVQPEALRNVVAQEPTDAEPPFDGGMGGDGEVAAKDASPEEVPFVKPGSQVELEEQEELLDSEPDDR